MAARIAKKDDVVVTMRCQCKGAVLVATSEVRNWKCWTCRSDGSRGKRLVLTVTGMEEEVA